MNPNIENSWNKALYNEFQSKYFIELKKSLIKEKEKYVIFPKGSEIFNAYNLTPFDKVKVVIIGQDPYHGEGQAHGLSFSVPNGIKPPPSLVNIYKEIYNDLNIFPSLSGNLTNWAKQGVLLLNSILTVRKNEAGSHRNIGWENFTNATIRKISEEKDGVIFLLWGSFAQEKEIFINKNKHIVLKAAHPSPFSSYRGFFGCKHFSKTNEALTSLNKEIINWQIE
ncbi:MAG: uracil-DNA glycosylase [Bacteroidetes bacterium GWE2_29_8]|nr:MAG: uracil-DNA glycosylase [Bacteroidetes bacterium GWE2_29_8]OFY20342.1 MAG: uracil-DNA glycosylase [Bacteroidetes bacterium GWF2_29_10]